MLTLNIFYLKKCNFQGSVVVPFATESPSFWWPIDAFLKAKSSAKELFGYSGLVI